MENQTVRQFKSRRNSLGLEMYQEGGVGRVRRVHRPGPLVGAGSSGDAARQELEPQPIPRGGLKHLLKLRSKREGLCLLQLSCRWCQWTSLSQEPSCGRRQTTSVTDREGLFPTHVGGRVLPAALLHLPIILTSGLKNRCAVLLAEKGSRAGP